MEHIGEKFRRLTIIEFVKKDSHYRKYYLCKCDCGNTKIVRYDCLTSGNTKSCGCMLKESAIRNGKNNAKNIKGMKFGRLTAIERTDRTDEFYTTFWKCKCDCGKELEVRTSDLIKGHTKSCGCFRSEVHSKRMKGNNNWNHKNKGKKHPNYNHELTDEERIANRDTMENINWRESVYKRDNYTCQKCNKRGNQNINAHHISNYFSDEINRYNVDNGITFCVKCHKKFHKEYGLRNNNIKQLMDFLKDNTEVTKEIKKSLAL